MRVFTKSRGRSMSVSDRRSGLRAFHVPVLFGLLVGTALPVTGQDQPLAHIDDEILHLTPVMRQLDYIRFLPSLGKLNPGPSHTELYSFDNVLLPATTWLDDDPDSTVKRHLATASDIRRSVIPQTNPRGTVSLLLNGNGETPLDSEEGQSGFRSNGPALRDVANPDSEIPMFGSWTAIPVILTLSRFLWHKRLRRSGPTV